MYSFNLQVLILFNGKYGSFRDPKCVFNALCILDDACEIDGNVNDKQILKHSNQNVSPNLFDVLVGNYQAIMMENLSVKLRDFPEPIFFTSKMEVLIFLLISDIM